MANMIGMDAEEETALEAALQDVAANLVLGKSTPGWTPSYVTFADKDGDADDGNVAIQAESTGAANGKKMSFRATCCPDPSTTATTTTYCCTVDRVVYYSPSATIDEISSLFYQADSAKYDLEDNSGSNNMNMPSYM